MGYSSSKSSTIKDKFIRVCLATSELSEIRMQRMLPGKNPPGFYSNRSIQFTEYFLSHKTTGIQEFQRCIVAGASEFIEPIGRIVNKRLNQIVKLTGKEIPVLLIYIADQKTLVNRYAIFKGWKGPAPFAVNGAQSCYFNTLYFKKLGIDNPAVVRAVIHEPTHPAFNLTILNRKGFPTFQIDDKDKIVSEALAGPNDPKHWLDLQKPLGVTLDFKPLEYREVGLYQWIDANTAQYKVRAPYFKNWIVAEFYRWASKKGNLAYWYSEALKLRE